MSLIDTHCHLDCEPLRSHLDEALTSACQAGVIACVVPGVHPSDWGRVSALAPERAGMKIFPAFGIHPMHAAAVNDAVLMRLSELSARGIAIGEIGLDPAYGIDERIQEQAFREQVRLAVALGLPVLVHCRRSFSRTLQILREEKTGHVGGIMHAFSGSPEMAREFIRLGFAISLSGTVTWDRAVRPVRLAREIPSDSLVLETDAPDLTPHPFRGQPNQPAWLRDVMIAVADIRGTLVTEVAHASVANTRRILSRMAL
ncbi:TatD family hydrolase [Geobacter sp. SVR]|uniref:TatD family hydrolase n=1 Tax=Geobacter sp. SVR TaxID=2495594 RepID=UPI001EF3A5E2|nr:TatD family hydrolase [Geobacter sp. SVR]